MKRTASVLAVTTALLAGAAQAETYAFDTETLEVYGVRVGNPVDPATWWNGHGMKMSDMEPLAINPMDPDFWVTWIDPKRHGHAHMTFMNPAAMAQFMEFETYTAMVDLDIWAKWFDISSYAPLLDLQTYAYWMQPGAYAHVFDVSQFEPMLEVDNYAVVMTTALDTLGIPDWAEAGTKALAAVTE